MMIQQVERQERPMEVFWHRFQSERNSVSGHVVWRVVVVGDDWRLERARAQMV